MQGQNLEGNSEAIEAWNTVLFDKFVQFRDILSSGLGIHGDRALERSELKQGGRVLDVGCGFGDTTLVLARHVGPSGKAAGVDAAPRFIESARREAKEAGVTNADFEVVDVQTGNLGGPYDAAFSRMGTMFFESPVAAMRNVRKSLVPGGRLSMAVWRRKDENPFLSLVEQRVLELVTMPERTDQVTCGPGPFSMASPDLVSTQLLAAGFVEPTFERFDADVFIGKDVAAAIEFALTVGPAGEVMRLSVDGERKRPQIVAALEGLMKEFSRPNGVFGRSSSWIVTARAP